MQDVKALFAQLARPFRAEDLEFRIQSSGITKSTQLPWARVLVYVSARAHASRLDEVFGADNWQVDFTQANGGFICKLGIKCNGEWVWKSDGSGETEVKDDPSTNFKGGISGAFKRACTMWGSGRYLYDVGDLWAVFNKENKGRHSCKIDGTYYYWNEPAMPKEFLPEDKKDDVPEWAVLLPEEVRVILKKKNVKKSEVDSIYENSDSDKAFIESIKERCK